MSLHAGVYGREFDIRDGSITTLGDVVTGGGSNHVKVRSNGINWMVAGKWAQSRKS